MLGFLRRRLGSAEEAEDVLQAFMLRALERSAELRDVRTVRGWLSRILATTIVDHQRRAARRRQREAVMSPDDLEALSIEPDVELDEAVCNCLYKLLPTIKPEYAEVIWRVDLLGEPRDRSSRRLRIWTRQGLPHYRSKAAAASSRRRRARSDASQRQSRKP